MKYSPGDDVIVEFQAKDHSGEVVRHAGGYVMCLIDIDPEWDYGQQSARLDPRSTVCVREKYVRAAASSQQGAST
jgi:heat shock protein HspQ